MKNMTNVPTGQSDHLTAATFNFHLPAKRNRYPRPAPWGRIIIKLLAFALGCLISLAFGLYDDSLSATAKNSGLYGQSVADQAVQSSPDDN